MSIKPERLSDAVTLYEGDCLDVLPTLTGVDAVVTDPPYGIAYATNRVVRGVGASWINTTIANDECTTARDEVISWANSNGTPWACFGSWKMPKPESTRGVLIWDKGPASGMGDLSFPWKCSWEEIYIGGKRWGGFRGEGILKGHTVVTWESKGRCHPNEKPVSLIRSIIEKLGADVILDPFAGSGTTGVAAALENRRAILIEKDPHYCDIIRRRIAEAEATGPGSLFKNVKHPELFAAAV